MDPIVDVNIAVYNHAPFLRKALDGVLAQKTNFPFRLLIGDDCSTDGSIAILKEYESKFSERIKVIYQPKNLGLNSVERNGVILLRHSTAKYIALLDGDDYWTDPLKLQKQVDFLETNSEIFGCFHDVVVVDENDKIIRDNYYEPQKKIFDQIDSLTYGGAYCTGSLMFRSLILRELPQWFLKSTNDYTIDLLITEFGNIAHLSENMGAYRVHKGGTWQGNSEHKNLEKVIERFLVCLTYPKFRKEYGDFFHNKIGELSARVALHYNKDRNYTKKMKYVWNYAYYTRPRNVAFIKYLFGTLLFPSIHKMTGRFFSKRNNRSEA